MVTRRKGPLHLLTPLGIVLLVVSAMFLGSHYFGHGRVGRMLSSASLPPGLSPTSVKTPAPAVSRTPATDPRGPAGTPGRASTPSPSAALVKPGIPVTVISADHHLNATVQPDRLNADGSLFVPPNPRTVSWSSQDVAPGTSYGTVIVVGHVNSGGVPGAFSDLADYRVGQVITLVLSDGRRMKYAVATEPIEVKKDSLGPRRQELFDQTHSYGLPGQPRSSRLLLLSCGGVFDNASGHYESNIFVYALPA